jgi:hypothetical protein
MNFSPTCKTSPHFETRIEGSSGEGISFSCRKQNGESVAIEGHIHLFGEHIRIGKDCRLTLLTLQQSRMPQGKLSLRNPACGGVKGEVVVNYCEPLTTRKRRTSSGDGVSSTFPKGKKHGKFPGSLGFHHRLIPGSRIHEIQSLAILSFIHSLPCFFVQLKG